MSLTTVTTRLIRDAAITTAKLAANAVTLAKLGVLTTKGDLLTHDGTDHQRLGVGTDGQVLQADTASPDGVKWATPSAGTTSPLTTKGDVWGYDTDDARVPVGANGQVLTADSTDPQGVKWAAPAAAYTDEDAQDAVGAMLVDTTSIDLTYTDATPSLTAAIKSGGVGAAELATDAVKTIKIKDSNVTAGKLATNAVTTAKLAANAVTLAKLGGLTTKGDLLTHDGTNHVRLPVGADNLVLVTDSAQTDGVKWGLPTVHGVSVTDGALSTSVPNNTLTAINLATSAFDTDSYANATDDTLFEIGSAALAGLYLVVVGGQYNDSTPAAASYQINLDRYIAGSFNDTLALAQVKDTGAAGRPYLSLAWLGSLNNGDGVKLEAFQASGGTIPFRNAFLTVVKIGDLP